MTLNDFIARATKYFDKAEAAQAGTAELSAANARIAELEKQAASDKAAISDRDTQIGNLTAELEKAKTAATEAEGKLATTSAALETEKKRVDETLAGMGVDPKGIPAEKPAARAESDILSKFHAITDPGERTLFFRKNRKEIGAAWLSKRNS